jgi:hypothetical protein
MINSGLDFASGTGSTPKPAQLNHPVTRPARPGSKVAPGRYPERH